MVQSATAEISGGKSKASAAPSGGGDSLTSTLPLKIALAVATILLIVPAVALAQTQSHPLSQVSPIDTNLDLSSKNISSLNYLLYSGGIFYSGSQGIPSADIATSAVTGAKIASGVVTSSKLSNPLGGSLNASAYYDSDSSTFFIDPAGISNSFNSAGPIIINSGANSPTAGSGQTILSNLADSLYIGVPASNNLLRGFIGSNEVLRVDSSGRVGIGTTEPTSLLHMVDGNLTVGDGGGNDLEIGTVRFSTDSTSTRWGGIQGFRGADAATIDLRFFTMQGDVEGVSERMRITDTGKVGIGTKNPQQELEIVGDLNVTGTIYGAINTTGDVNCTECVDTADIANSAVTSAKIANGAVTTSDLSNPLGGSVNATTYYDSDNSAYYMDLASSGTSMQTAGTIRLPNNVGGIFLGNTSGQYGSTQIFTDTSDRLKIIHGGINPVIAVESSGNVGIGTASPGVKLHVAGDSQGNYGVYDTPLRVQGDTYSYVEVVGVNSQAGIVLNRDGSTGWLAGLDSDGKFRIADLASIDQTGLTNAKDGTEGITIDTAGNVGIGTSGPSALLNVYGSPVSSIIGNFTTTGDASLIIQGTGSATDVGLRLRSRPASDWVWTTSSADDLELREIDASNARRIVVQNNTGRVGIGVLNPSSMMHLQLGTADFTTLPITAPTNTPGLVMEGSTSDDSSTPQIILADEASGSSSNAAFIDFLTKDPSSANYDRWVIGRRGYASSTGNLNRFIIGYTTDANAHSAFNDPAVSISSNNNVGIGTISPQQRLEVAGNVNISGSAPNSGVNLTLINTYSNPGYTRLVAYEDSGGFGVFGNGQITQLGTTSVADYTARGSVAFRGVAAASSNSYFDFSLSSSGANPQTLTSVMRLTADGNVGIGTTSPQSTLHVNGTGNTYLQLDTNTTALSSTDCDSEAERGRMIVDGSNIRLHICYGTSGWKTLTPA